MFKPNDIIYYFEIKVDFKNDKVATEENQHKVLASRKDKFVIDDNHFTKIDYKKQSYNMNDVFKKSKTYHFKHGIDYDYVVSHIYTQFPSKKIACRILKKDLEKFIYENFGRYCKAAELLNTLIIQGWYH